MYANLLAEIARKGWNKKVLAKNAKVEICNIN